MICQQHIPFIADRVIALSLSDDDDTPGQINLFLSYIPSFSQFTHLRSFAAFNVRLYGTLMKIIDECYHLCNLTHLKFDSCALQDDETDFQLIVNNIWNLSKLIHCNFGIDFNGQRYFRMPTIISLSIESVSISSKIKLKWNQIDRLCEYTPRLTRLSINSNFSADEDCTLSPLPTLIALNIRSSNLTDMSKMVVLLKNMPNLRRLNINLTSNIIDGHQWEQIIRNHLFKLQVFLLKMREIFLVDQNIQKRVDELINSFQSPFWIDEHQWFVRCFSHDRTIYLHTLSKRFHYYRKNIPDVLRSTGLNDDQKEFYNSLSSIYNETFFDESIPSFIRWPNIRSLHIKLPINDQFWFIISSLNRLDSLTVSCHIDNFQSELQTLLDRAPHLYHLTISQDASLPLQISLFKYTNASVRRLSLIHCSHCFTDEECIALSYSPLGIHCEILSILVNNRECIITLVNNMFNLRALNVRCEHEKYYKQLALVEDNNEKYYDEKIQSNDEIIQWLKYRLPPACSILRKPYSLSDVLIWIQ